MPTTTELPCVYVLIQYKLAQSLGLSEERAKELNIDPIPCDGVVLVEPEYDPGAWFIGSDEVTKLYIDKYQGLIRKWQNAVKAKDPSYDSVEVTH